MFCGVSYVGTEKAPLYKKKPKTWIIGFCVIAEADFAEPLIIISIKFIIPRGPWSHFFISLV